MVHGRIEVVDYRSVTRIAAEDGDCPPFRNLIQGKRLPGQQAPMLSQSLVLKSGGLVVLGFAGRGIAVARKDVQAAERDDGLAGGLMLR